MQKLQTIKGRFTLVLSFFLSGPLLAAGSVRTLCQMEPYVGKTPILWWLILNPAGSKTNVMLVVSPMKHVLMTTNLMFLLHGVPTVMM